MTLKVIAAIHWQALRLWLKRTPFFTTIRHVPRRRSRRDHETEHHSRRRRATPPSERLGADAAGAGTCCSASCARSATAGCGSSTAALDAVFGERDATGPFDVTLRVRNPRFYSDVVFAGTVGAGEAYINGLVALRRSDRPGAPDGGQPRR